MFASNYARKFRSDLASDYRRKRSDLMFGAAKSVIKRAHKSARRNARKEIAAEIATLLETRDREERIARSFAPYAAIVC